MSRNFLIDSFQSTKDGSKCRINPMSKKSKTFWNKLFVILAMALLTWELRADSFELNGEYTDLFKAVRRGKLEELEPLVESFIAQGKNISDALNEPYPSGLRTHKQNLLHEACKWDRLEIIEYLISKGLDVNAKDELGLTPLMIAVSTKHRYYNKDSNSVTTSSISSEKIRYLLLKGADPLAKSKSGMTLLHYAAYRGLDWFVEDLIAAKMDPNASDQNGWTPLHSATSGGHKNTVEILIRKGGNPKVKSEEGYTLIHIAAGHGGANLDLIPFLIQNGANINAKLFDNGETPLHIAVNKNDPQIIRLLLANGALPNIYDSGREKNTPLHIAVKYNFVECAKILLKYGADPNIKNGFKESPAELARRMGHRQHMSDLFKNK
ncbi:ankyrin repeat domain-containing protein [Leptospira interrogans serovar Canicola]|uniref:Ankyrin repeat domain-containing protein n=1 Tax=Leptospira interrogans serovar Canicola TaxID=211880 RepID=A0AAQ0AXL1_LEPIR|nr:ankyrin repeat domain-containing protein [Leptospira interrogans]QOI42546.1 ankyrin repeat domain-containing protein [Leptospira interrogans serovar Canicola]